MAEGKIVFRDQIVYAANDIIKKYPLFRIKVVISEIEDNVLIKDYEVHWCEKSCVVDPATPPAP